MRSLCGGTAVIRVTGMQMQDCRAGPGGIDGLILDIPGLER